MSFRVRLSAEIGVVLGDMEGFTKAAPIPGVDADNFGENLDRILDQITKKGKSWDTITDPIAPLLNHSDCDGALTPDECSKIAPRLRELIAGWGDDYDKEQALLLANGMDACANTQLALIFK